MIFKLSSSIFPLHKNDKTSLRYTRQKSFVQNKIGKGRVSSKEKEEKKNTMRAKLIKVSSSFK